MHRQGRAPIGKALSLRMDDHVEIAVGRLDADIGVGVEPPHLRKIGSVNPEGGQSPQGVIEGWLAALLPPRLLDAGVLHWQPPAVGQMLDERVVPQLIGGLKEGRDHAVDRAQNKEAGQDESDGPMLPHELNRR